MRIFLMLFLGVAFIALAPHEGDACSRKLPSCSVPAPKPHPHPDPTAKSPDGESPGGLRSGGATGEASGTTIRGDTAAKKEADAAIKIDPDSVRSRSGDFQPSAPPYRASPFPKHPSVTRDYRGSNNPYHLGRVDTENRDIIVTVQDVNVSETVQRAQKGAGRYRGDGTPYENKNKKLPKDTYTRWTHPTPSLTNAGGQRIVIGKTSRSVYYSPDHYKTFWILK